MSENPERFRPAPTSVPAGPEERRAFLQYRVSRFALVAGGGSLAFLLFRVVMVLVTRDPAHLLAPEMWLHGLGTIPMIAVYLLCRGKPRSERFVSVTETTGVLGACVCFCAMATTIPWQIGAHFIAMLAMLMGLFARTVYVPTTGRRTLTICIIVGVALLVSTYLGVALEYDAETFGRPMVGSEFSPAQRAVGNTIAAAVWWSLFTLLCTVASGMIHGLRQQAGRAKQLGQYALEEELGRGGMGVVYRANHAMLRRPTAIKLLPPETAGEDALARFEREVRLTARLEHPNTVTVFDYGRTSDGTFYYAMELLDGMDLGTLVTTTGAMHPARVAHVMAQAAASLEEAHGAGLVHRDIKPANIMLCRHGGRLDVVKVLDFGLVKEIETGADSELTQEGLVTGTPQYMSPEAIRAELVDARSDIYALGAVAYFALTGDHMFRATSIIALCSMHLNDEPEPPSSRLGRAIPDDLERLVLECLAKDPGERPGSASEILRRLEGITAAAPWSQEDAAACWAGEDPALEVDKRYVHEAFTRTLAVDLTGKLDG